jgi:spermidine synthase
VVRGRARELRIDGSFASRWRPGALLTGSVWDALAAPLAWLAPQRRRRLLLLGLGGGSAARILRALAPQARIVGVEIDPGVVRLARRHLGLDALGVEVVVGDARAFLEGGRERFDLVIEDVFLGPGRAERKPDWLPLPGLARAARRLAPGGLLVSNALDESAAVARALRGLLPALVRVELPGWENRVLVGGPPGFSAQALRRAVAREPLLAPALPRLRMRTLEGTPQAKRAASRQAPRARAAERSSSGRRAEISRDGLRPGTAARRG